MTRRVYDFITLFVELLGSGGYADDNIGTVSTTGYGDAILRYNVALRILAAMEHGKPLVFFAHRVSYS